MLSSSSAASMANSVTLYKWSSDRLPNILRYWKGFVITKGASTTSQRGWGVDTGEPRAAIEGAEQEQEEAEEGPW